MRGSSALGVDSKGEEGGGGGRSELGSYAAGGGIGPPRPVVMTAMPVGATARGYVRVHGPIHACAFLTSLRVEAVPHSDGFSGVRDEIRLFAVEFKWIHLMIQLSWPVQGFMLNGRLAYGRLIIHR